MTVNPKIECNLYSGPITSEAVFEYFSHLILMDAGSDGFRLKDATGGIVTIPTGIPVNMNYLAQSGRICRYMSVMAPLSGTLNVTYVSDVPKGSPTDIFTANSLKLGGYYNWFAINTTGTVKFGYLYNWYAATDARNIAPPGWHAPTNLEMLTLRNNLDPAHPPALYYLNNLAGGKMKQVGFSSWNSPNTGADNSSGLNIPGGGFRTSNGTFSTFGNFVFMVNTYDGGGNACGEGELSFNSAGFWYDETSLTYKNLGFMVRLIKDDSTDTGTMTGNDGRVYATVKIGNQVWMAENLAETKFQNGDLITKVTADSAWAALTSEGYCALNNDETNAFTGGFAPAGYHVPTFAEQITLINYLLPGEGGKLKEVNPLYWIEQIGVEGTNSTGFSGRGIGQRNGVTGAFEGIKEYLEIWSSTQSDATHALAYQVGHYAHLNSAGFSPLKTTGLAVRFIKDDPSTWSPGDTVTDADGNEYNTVQIGSQVLTKENHRGVTLNDGTPIANVTDDAVWPTLSTPAVSFYDLPL
jgi:uncharacterized protein (TIGR02145 family)